MTNPIFKALPAEKQVVIDTLLALKGWAPVTWRHSPCGWHMRVHNDDSGLDMVGGRNGPPEGSFPRNVMLAVLTGELPPHWVVFRAAPGYRVSQTNLVGRPRHAYFDIVRSRRIFPELMKTLESRAIDEGQ